MITQRRYLSVMIMLLLVLFAAQSFAQGKFSIKDNYSKIEYKIPMRDGKKLFTAVYSPKDTSEKYPILIWRTPYSCAPYGAGKYRHIPKELAMDKFIFVYQDVRGRFMSEGKYVNMRPYIPNKTDSSQVDESSDAYDTIDWLVKNIPNNNGKVGVYGISYPGFYAAMSTIDANPALKAVSPQAPISNWFIDDDMHHNGAFSLLMSYNFFSVFGVKRDSLTTHWPKRMQYPSPDAYTFMMRLEPIPNINKRYFNGRIAFWNEMLEHPNYDKYWQSRNTLPHFNNIKPAVMTVGGWYDSEDFYGSINTYKSIEEKNPNTKNILVVGPWPHGWWARSDGEKLGDMNFGSKTSEYYRTKIQLPFFKYYLKGEGSFNQAEARMFNTGINKWRSFKQWPPKNIFQQTVYLEHNNRLSFKKPTGLSRDSFDEYTSDPRKPVPYTAKILDSHVFYNKAYMNEDQRFAAYRPDVLVYQTESLDKDVTLVGKLIADLFVSTTGTDADWVVKLIDVYPDSTSNPKPNTNHVEMGGYQLLVRYDIMRGKYRNSYKKPEAFKPGKVTEVKVPLQDVLHTFKRGHKIMIQIQSSMFPFYDVNPQTFTDIYHAKARDFKKAENRVYFSKEYPSSINFKVLP